MFFSLPPLAALGSVIIIFALSGLFVLQEFFGEEPNPYMRQLLEEKRLKEEEEEKEWKRRKEEKMRMKNNEIHAENKDEGFVKVNVVGENK